MSMKELLEKIENMSNVVLPAISERTEIITEAQKGNFAKKHVLIKIPKDSYVMIRIPQRTGKLDPIYEGPYKVENETKGGSYVLSTLQGELLPRNYPPSALKVISQDEIVPAEDIYDIESIIDHKKHKGNYLYKVRWKGYGPKGDTWEPPQHFTDPNFIKSYWERIGEEPNTKPENNAKKHKRKTPPNLNAANKRRKDQ